MSKEIYLDNNATTKPIDQVRAAMMDVLGDGFGNPSSTHAAGERGRSPCMDRANRSPRASEMRLSTDVASQTWPCRPRHSDNACTIH